jgi:hypothetical protein
LEWDKINLVNDLEQKFKQLAEELIQLREFVPETKDELDRWHDQAQLVIDNRLKGSEGVSQFMPHFLWHYLSDADIRMKEEGYAEMQNQRLTLLIEDLNRGVISAEDDKTLTVPDIFRKIVGLWKK